MARDRSEFTKGLDAMAYAVQVDGQWFAGFGGDKQAPIVKFRKHLCEAKLMVSRQRGVDYIKRLGERGHQGGVVRTVVVSAPQQPLESGSAA